jgi:glucose-1-phosphate thymidylyltransferase
MSQPGTNQESWPRPPLDVDSEPAERVVAVIPAAGRARRLGDSVPGSKEVANVGGEPVCVHLLRRLAVAGVSQAIVVLGDGKWDVPETLLGYRSLGVDLAYVVVGNSPSELHSVAAGLSFTNEGLVALGYPDILFEPRDAFSALLNCQSSTNADLVLGLFPTDHPEKVDMVVLDSQLRPVEVVIKQPDRGLRYSWSIAVWTSRFSSYLVDFLVEVEEGRADDITGQGPREPSVGDVVQAALDEGLAVEAVVFDQGGYLDVGTPDDLAEARRLATRFESNSTKTAPDG